MTWKAQLFPQPTPGEDEFPVVYPSDPPEVEPASSSQFSLARELLASGRAQDALDLLEREIAHAEESAELLFWVGRAAFGSGDFVRAQRALSRAAELSPLDAETQRWLARVLVRRGHASDAMCVWRRSTRSTVPPKTELDSGQSE